MATMNTPPLTVSLRGLTDDQALDLAAHLVSVLAWFQVTPLPGGEWEVTVKEDRKAELSHTPKHSSELMAALEALQHEHRNYGAEDSEPEYHREQVIRAAEEGKPFPVGNGGNPWELYSSMTGYRTINLLLTNKAREYYNARIRERLGI